MQPAVGLKGARTLHGLKLVSLKHLNVIYRGRCMFFSFYILEEGEQIGLAKVTHKLMTVGYIPGLTCF